MECHPRSSACSSAGQRLPSLLSPGGGFSAFRHMAQLWDCIRALAKMQKRAGRVMKAGPAASGLVGIAAAAQSHHYLVTRQLQGRPRPGYSPTQR